MYFVHQKCNWYFQVWVQQYMFSEGAWWMYKFSFRQVSVLIENACQETEHLGPKTSSGTQRKIRPFCEQNLIDIVDWSEAEVVNVFIKVIFSFLRNYLVFVDCLRNFGYLVRLCTHVNSTMFTDNRRATLDCNSEPKQQWFRPLPDVTGFRFGKRDTRVLNVAINHQVPLAVQFQ